MNEPSRPSPWRFDWRVFTLAKDAEYPTQNQDACLVRRDGRFAAMADGVSSAIFSRPWARLLVEAIQDEPDVEDRQALADWLRQCRQTWSRRIDASQLQWFQRPKLREGAFSTLLWARLIDDPQGDSVRLQARAIGDSCLFLLRDGRTLKSFPLAASADLERRPLALGSVDLHHDDLLAFGVLEESCCLGDLVILCTDALAAWALRLVEAGDEPPWESFWTMNQPQWQDHIQSLRAEQLLAVDDTTLAMLRVTDAPLPADDGTSESASGLREPAEVPDVVPEVPSSSRADTAQTAIHQEEATAETGLSARCPPGANAPGSPNVPIEPAVAEPGDPQPAVRVPLPPPGPIRWTPPPAPSASGAVEAADVASAVTVPHPPPPKPPSLLEVVAAEEASGEAVIDRSGTSSEDCPDELRAMLESLPSRPESEPSPTPSEKKEPSPTRRLLRGLLTGVEKFFDDFSPKDKKKQPGG